MNTTQKAPFQPIMSNPLLKTDKFISLFKDDNLLTTTFSLLCEQLRLLEERDIKNKCGSTTLTEYTNLAKIAQDHAPKLIAIEKLFQPLNVRKELIRSFSRHGLDAQRIQEDIINLYSSQQKEDEKSLEKTTIKSDPSEFRKNLLRTWNTNYTVQASFFLGGSIRNTYSHTQVSFYENYAAAYAAQVNITLLEHEFSEKSYTLHTAVETLSQEIQNVIIDDPFTELTKVTEEFEASSQKQLSVYRATLLKQEIQTKVQQLEKAANAIHQQLETRLEQLEKSFTDFAVFSDSTLDSFKQTLLDTEKTARESKLKQLVISYKLNLAKNYIALKNEIKLEKKIETTSQIHALTHNTDLFHVKIKTALLANAQEAWKNLDDLQKKSDDTTKLFNNTYQKLADYETKIANLHKTIPDYERFLLDEGAKKLTPLLIKREDCFTQLSTAIKGFKVDDEFAAHLLSDTQYTKDIESGSRDLAERLQKNIQGTHRLLNRFVDIYKTYNEKSSKMRRMLDKEIPTEQKTPCSPPKTSGTTFNVSERFYIERALTKLSEELKKQAISSKTQILAQQNSAIKSLETFATMEISKAWNAHILKQFQEKIDASLQRIRKIKTKDSLAKLEPLETKFIADTLASIQKEENDTRDQESKKQNKTNTQSIQKAEQEMKKTMDGTTSPKLFAATQRTAILLQHSLARSSLEAREPVTVSRKKNSPNRWIALFAAVFFPVALIIGSTEIYRKVKFKYNSAIFAGITAFFGSFIPLVSIYSYYLGVSRIYTGRSIADTAVLSITTPKIPSKTSTSPRSGHISLPSTSSASQSISQLQTQIATCINTRVDEEENRLYIETKPNAFYFNGQGGLFLKNNETNQTDIHFSKHAADFILRVLKLIKKPEDLTVDMSHLPFVSIRIKQISGETQYFISPHVTNDGNLLFCPDEENGRRKKQVLPIQFAKKSSSQTDSNLQTLLYPQEYAIPKQRRFSDDNFSTGPAANTTRHRASLSL